MSPTVARKSAFRNGFTQPGTGQNSVDTATERDLAKFYRPPQGWRARAQCTSSTIQNGSPQIHPRRGQLMLHARAVTPSLSFLSRALTVMAGVLIGILLLTAPVYAAGTINIVD